MLQQIKAILHDWYKINHRELPWRQTNDPYFIWLSEIILQQTRVQQGQAYYERFTRKFPTVTHLAMASEQEVLALWQGLGYYSRARNLHATAQRIQNEFQGQFPNDYPSIRSLKGIGDYTAAAIASFAFDLPHAVLDGNVYRVLSRLFDIETAIDSTAGQKLFQNLANDLLDQNSPALHNQAIMEFGALYCVPSSPDCPNCPLASFCLSKQNNTTHLRPFKEKKTKVTPITVNYSIQQDKDKIVLVKRLGKGIWQNLHEFPRILHETPMGMLLHSEVHLLSHQRLTLNYYLEEKKESETNLPENHLWVKKSDLPSIPKPKPIQHFINTFLFLKED